VSWDKYPSVSMADALRTAALVFKLDVLEKDGGIDLSDKEDVVELAGQALYQRLHPLGPFVPDLPTKPADNLPDFALRVLAGLRKDRGM